MNFFKTYINNILKKDESNKYDINKMRVINVSMTIFYINKTL